jgi:hypothetical protein
MKPFHISFLLLSSIVLGCKSKDILTSCASKPTEVVIQQFVKAQGTIRQYSASNTFYIELNKCVDCLTLRPNPPGLTAPASPCNLPKSFQNDGLSVDFTGFLRVDTTVNYSAIDISGIPLQLTSIKRR